IRARIKDRINAELVAMFRSSDFFVAEYETDIPSDLLKGFGARDFPIYLLDSRDTRMVARLAKRQLVTIDENGKEVKQAENVISGGRVTGEEGINLNSDVKGVRRGVSFVRIFAINAAPDLQGRFFGETVLHEFGHHMLDLGSGESAHRFGDIMDPKTGI